MTTPDRLSRRTFLVLAAAGTAPALGSRNALAGRSSDTAHPLHAGHEGGDEAGGDEAGEPVTDAEAVIGEPVDHDGWRAVVSAVDHRMLPSDQSSDVDSDDSDGDDEPGRSDDGAVMGPHRGGPTVTVALQNTGDGVLAAAARPEIRLRVDGQADDIEPTTLGEAETTGRLAPGEVDRRELRFRLSGDRAPPETPGEPPAGVLLVDPPEEGSTPHTVDLTREVESAVELAQDLAGVQEFGASVEAEGIELTPTDLEQGTDLGGATDDRELVVMGLRIANDSDREHTPAANQFELKDDTGRSLPQTEDGPGIVDDFAFDPIAAGEAAEGEFVYEIDDAATELFFVADSAPWGVDRRAFWQLR